MAGARGAEARFTSSLAPGDGGQTAKPGQARPGLDCQARPSLAKAGPALMEPRYTTTSVRVALSQAFSMFRRAVSMAWTWAWG